MFEKVNKYHPDKLCDRIAGAIVDYAYSKRDNPHIAVEVLLGHGKCHIICETDTHIRKRVVWKIVERIAGYDIKLDYKEVAQDIHLNGNQANGFRCGDNGIFKGTPITQEQKKLSEISHKLQNKYKSDGKYILDGKKLIICQSYANDISEYPNAIVNPLGFWTGGSDVDTGATNRKLGSDMGDGVTGGGLHGKDLSKADVSVNIYCFLKAQELGKAYKLSCAIGDEFVDGKPYSEIVEIAREYINKLGGFENFAEEGLVREYELDNN